jgi:hypothetical protein
MESKYHQIKKKLYILPTEEKEYRKSSITKMIEQYYLQKKEIPQEVIENINFLENIYFNYYMNNKEYNMHIDEKQTIAENLMDLLPLEMYEKYMDISWLMSNNSNNENRLISNLIFRERWDVLEKFLSLINKETKENDFNKVFFEEVFDIEKKLDDCKSFKKEKNYVEKVKNYFSFFEKTLIVFKDFHQYKCEQFKARYRDVEKWHKNFEYIYELNHHTELKNINEFLLEQDDFLDIIKNICKQYDNPKNNSLLTKENFKKVIKHGNENIFLFFMSEFLKNNFMQEKEIEELIKESFQEKVEEIIKKNKMFFHEGKNSLKNTDNIDKVYNIVQKYSQYKPSNEELSTFLLIDNLNINKLIIKNVPKNKIKLLDLNLEELIAIKIIFQDILKTQKMEESFWESYKKDILKIRVEPEVKKELLKYPCQLLYLSEKISKLYPNETIELKDKSMSKVLNAIEKHIFSEFKQLESVHKNYTSIKLQYKLNELLEQKKETKKLKI